MSDLGKPIENLTPPPEHPVVPKIEPQLPIRSEIISTTQSAVTAIDENAGKAAQLVGEDDARTQQIKDLHVKAESIAAGVETKLKRMEQPYIMSEELAKVVEVAQVLGKPLLLEGEPGCGKTSLPYAVAAENGMKLIHAQCKSTTTAQELLYTFDHLGRMRDAQMGLDISDVRKYVRLGPLGQAFSATESVVLVVDEVDKAKRNFLNDLLQELDQMSFMIPETGEEIAASVRPQVFITSNHERDLPEPALRRCLYHYLEFPTAEHMEEIVKAHVPNITDELLDQALEQFYELRAIKGIQKKPSTSEILDWTRALSAFGIKELQGIAPHLETLIKNKIDLRLVMKHQQEMQRVLGELGLGRADLEFCFEPAKITKERSNGDLSQRIAGKDELGRVIIRLPDGTQYVKTIVTEQEQNDENYYDRGSTSSEQYDDY